VPVKRRHWRGLLAERSPTVLGMQAAGGSQELDALLACARLRIANGSAKLAETGSL
jgi:hypothetical protein